MICEKSYCLAKLANSCDAYCGLLLLTSTCGTPCLENIDFKAETMLLLVVDDNFMTSGYREK